MTYTDESVVYFIQSVRGGPIKIGHSGSEEGAQKRLADMQVGNSVELRITHMEVCSRPGLYVERDLHEFYSTFRIRGEWFEPVSELAIRARAIPLGKGRNGKLTKEAWDRGFVAGWRAAMLRIELQRRANKRARRELQARLINL